MAEQILTSPGKLRMKCMIWEPNPISERTSQDVTVVYNATTIKSLPENIQKKMHSHQTPPYGVYLLEKYVYRDTFLKIGNEFLNSDRPDMKAENGDPLFTRDGVPAFSYIEHQTFQLNGSLFSPNIVTPSAIKVRPGSVEVVDNGLSKWSYLEMQVPYNHDGHKTDEKSNSHDYVAAVGKGNWEQGFEEAVTASSLAEKQKNYVIARKTRRFIPCQVAASSEQKGSGNASNKPKSIHWLCQKQTPMYSMEDFFVEFVRLAYAHDIVADSKPMQDEYLPIDSRHTNVTDGVIRNAGVVEIGEDGAISEDSVNTFNLSNQPYYLIEMGKGSAQHHYFIILAYNAHPIFVQVGRQAVLTPATPSTPPRVSIPPFDVSRRLSTYEDVSCKELMSQESLRVTVRGHLGKIIITFSGHEGTPWVISRADYDGDAGDGAADAEAAALDIGEDEEDTDGIELTNVKEKPVAMEIASSPIQIGGGNMKCAFFFGPLHYEEGISFELPNAITLKGPVSESDVNLYLGERGQAFSAKNANSATTYFQDAEAYFETVNGQSRAILKTSIHTEWPIKAAGKDCNITSENRNKEGAAVSTISITKETTLGQLPSPPPPQNVDAGGATITTETISGTGEYLKWFNGRFSMTAGDADVPNVAFKGRPKWRICNCITPVSTGWRLYVPPNARGHNQTPVDVAHHVETFSHNWSYTDNSKVEHTGQIRFRVNLGTASSLRAQDAVPEETDDFEEAEVEEDDDQTEEEQQDSRIDQSSFLLGLADKSFFVRVYAWWEGGYMDCHNSRCPCRRPGGPMFGDPDNRHCIFTGICYGGEEVVEGNTRYMECQLFDYMKIMQDQFFINSPFFDGMNDYYAVALIAHMAGFSETPLGDDRYAPASLINKVAETSLKNSDEWVMPYSLTNESLFFMNYTLPSSYELLQNPFMKFGDTTTYDAALTKIGTLAGKVAFFDRFGTFRYDVRPDTQFLSKKGQASRRPKCNFMASPHALGNCANLDLLALNQYTMKRAVADVVNDILLVTATPQGEVLVKSVINFAGRHDPSQPGFIGYTKRLLQMDGIFGSQAALESIAKYYASMVFKPPVIVGWESMGVPHLQAMDIVTFTGLNDDLGFPPSNVEGGSTTPPIPSLTLVVSSLSGEIVAARGEWRNKYEGEWLYGTVS